MIVLLFRLFTFVLSFIAGTLGKRLGLIPIVSQLLAIPGLPLLGAALVLPAHAPRVRAPRVYSPPLFFLPFICEHYRLNALMPAPAGLHRIPLTTAPTPRRHHAEH